MPNITGVLLISLSFEEQDGRKEAQPSVKLYAPVFGSPGGSFRFAVSESYINFNPMQYVRMRVKKEEVETVSEGNAEMRSRHPTITMSSKRDKRLSP